MKTVFLYILAGCLALLALVYSLVYATLERDEYPEEEGPGIDQDSNRVFGSGVPCDLPRQQSPNDLSRRPGPKALP